MPRRERTGRNFSYSTFFTTAIDTVIDITITYVDIRVTKDITLVTTAIDLSTSIPFSQYKCSITSRGNRFLLTCSIVMSTRTDLYVRITIDITLITTSIDSTNGTDRKVFISFAICLGEPGKFRIRSILLYNYTPRHVHIDMRRSNQLSHVTTTIDFTNLCCRDNVNLRVTGWCSQCTRITFLIRNTLCYSCNHISIFILYCSRLSRVTIDGIRCQIATGIQLVNLNR